MAIGIEIKRTSIYETLSNIDITQYIKEKNGNKYLPWASCWNLVLKHYPHSTYKVNGQQISAQSLEDGDITGEKNLNKTSYTRPWFVDNTGWVEVEVTVIDDGFESTETVSHTEVYPIIDLRNKSIPGEQITSADANKSIKRALVKAVASCTGLGLFLFYGEDLPDEMAKVLELQATIQEIAKKKSGLSDSAKEKTIEICKKAEKEANPDWEDELITGKVTNIEDVDILKDLHKQLLKIRK